MTIFCPCCNEEICDEFAHCPECHFDIKKYNELTTSNEKEIWLESGKRDYVSRKARREQQLADKRQKTEALQKKREFQQKMIESHPDVCSRKWFNISIGVYSATMLLLILGALGVGFGCFVLALPLACLGYAIWNHGTKMIEGFKNVSTATPDPLRDLRCEGCGTAVVPFDETTQRYVVIGTIATRVGVLLTVLLVLALSLIRLLMVGYLFTILIIIVTLIVLGRYLFKSKGLRIEDRCPKCGSYKLVRFKM